MTNGTTLSFTVGQLTPGASYTFDVSARTLLGTGPASAPRTPAVTILGLPGLPGNVSATAGDASAVS